MGNSKNPLSSVRHHPVHPCRINVSHGSITTQGQCQIAIHRQANASNRLHYRKKANVYHPSSVLFSGSHSVPPTSRQLDGREPGVRVARPGAHTRISHLREDNPCPEPRTPPQRDLSRRPARRNPAVTERRRRHCIGMSCFGRFTAGPIINKAAWRAQ